MLTEKRKNEIKETILHRNGSIIYVDFVLLSLINSVGEWYDKHFQGADRCGTTKNAHVFHIIRLYEPERFKNHNSIGDERTKYLEEVDLHVQMKRDE